MSKAELQLHVVKLERSIARLRKQNAELKQDVRGNAGKSSATPVTSKSAATKSKRAVAPKNRRQPAKRANQLPASPRHDDDVAGSGDA